MQGQPLIEIFGSILLKITVGQEKRTLVAQPEAAQPDFQLGQRDSLEPDGPLVITILKIFGNTMPIVLPAMPA